jgi:hypothetical protein
MSTMVSTVTETTTSTSWNQMQKTNDDTDTATPMISDLTEGTPGTTTDMEEDNDGLAPILFSGIPSNIEKFTPKKQWNDDIARDLQKRQYGIELKISLEKRQQKPIQYQHIKTYEYLKL